MARTVSKKNTEQTMLRIRSWRSGDILSSSQNMQTEKHRNAIEDAEKIFRGYSAQEQTEQALRRERRKRRINHHAYDLGRHIRLVRLSQEKAQNARQFKE